MGKLSAEHAPGARFLRIKVFHPSQSLRYGEVSVQSGWRLIHGQAFGF
jgi:hypothetical protein